MPAEEPYATIALIGSAYWFTYFLVLLPLLGLIETPDPEPETIEEAVILQNKKRGLHSPDNDIKKKSNIPTE